MSFVLVALPHGFGFNCYYNKISYAGVAVRFQEGVEEGGEAGVERVLVRQGREVGL